jgi:transcriptional/translational regulatory protein YebC/TACO1
VALKQIPKEENNKVARQAQNEVDVQNKLEEDSENICKLIDTLEGPEDNWLIY